MSSWRPRGKISLMQVASHDDSQRIVEAEFGPLASPQIEAGKPIFFY